MLLTASKPGIKISMDINIVTLSGRLGADPESKGSDANPIASFRICVNGRKKEGEQWVDVPNWITCTAFKWQAQNLIQKASKGDELVVTGRIRQENWEVAGEKKSRISIVADNVKVVPRVAAPQAAPQLAEDMPF